MALAKKYDVIFVTDSTSSMGGFLDAIRLALQEVVGTIQLTGVVDGIAIVEYRDYCDKFAVRSSNWQTEFKPLAEYASKLIAMGGGDWPEAAKTAAKYVLDSTTKDTIVLWYADAPPHHPRFYKNNYYSQNSIAEKEQLGEWYDWVALCKEFARKKIRVFPVTNFADPLNTSFYCLLSEMTNGATIMCRNPLSSNIAKVTVSVLLAIVKQQVDFEKNVSVFKFVDTSALKSIRDEIDHAGYLPGHQTGVLRAIGEHKDIQSHIVPLEDISDDSFVSRFSKDPEYKNLVYSVFTSLFTSGHVTSITTNPLFGKLWRAICKDRKDSRRDTLVSGLNSAVSKLSQVKADAMKQFIEDSYDCTDEIVDTIAQVPTFPALVLDDDVQLTRHQLLEINRSCNNEVLSTVGKLLTGIRTVDDGPLPERYLPLSLESRDLFGYLPHLVVGGTVFSKRPSMILALLCTLTGNCHLKDKAKDILELNKGQWIDQDMPENFSYAFIKFVLKQPEFLTQPELDLYQQLNIVGGIKVNWSSNLTLTIGYKTNKILLPDYKVQCITCRVMRSTTLMTKDGVCGLCVSEVSGDEPCSDKSYFYECRSCLVHYAVVNTDNLRIQPKCYYCREGLDVPQVKCGLCTNTYISTSTNQQPNWTCAACNSLGKAKTEQVECSLGDDVWLSNTLVNTAQVVLKLDDVYYNVKIHNVKEFLEVKSPLKARDFVKFVKTAQVPQTAFYCRRKLIHDKDMIERVSDTVLRGYGDQHSCMMCFSDLPDNKLRKACDRRGCGIRCCVDCLKGWYGQSRPGSVVLPSHLLCAFCKQAPTFKLLSKYNRRLCTVKALDLKGWQDNWYYAWCEKCYRVKEYMEKVCAQGLPDVSGFNCEECVAVKQCSVLAKECPECGVMTEKTSGCDHITCRCGAHWCFVCGERQTSQSIYAHLSKEHGGYFVVRGTGEDDIDYSDEEEWY